MKTKGDRSEKVVTDDVGEAHQRAVIVGDALRALKAPNRAAENSAEIAKAMHVGVFEQLRTIVVNERVPERVEIRHPGEHQQSQDGQRVRTGTSSQAAAGSP